MVGSRTVCIHYSSFASYVMCHSFRALFLRNLVSEYECGRVFPAGVGPGSPSRDAATGCLRDSACRLRRASVWLAEDGVPRCAPLPSSNLVPFGRCGGTREAGSTIAESLIVLYRVGTHQIRRRWRAAQSSTSQGRAEPLCARITGLNREVSEGKTHV